MDSIKIMEITDSVEDPINQAGGIISTIEKNRKLIQSEEAKELLKEIKYSFEDVATTVNDVNNGRSLTINGLRSDAEKFFENSKKLEEIAQNTEIDDVSKMSVKNLSVIALQIKNIINQR